MTKIITQLETTAVVTALRELAPSSHSPRLFKSTFEGQIDHRHISIGYRFGWFIPPVPLVTFTGRLHESDNTTEIHGKLSTGWIFYLLAVWLLIAAPLSIYQALSNGDFSAVAFAIAAAVILLILGRGFVRSTQAHVVNEIGRAVRGIVSES